jgi:hypothetical protein
VSITATTQLPAYCRRPLHLLKTLLPSPAARRRTVAEIACALPNLSWNHSVQLLATEASHAHGPPKEPSEHTRRGTKGKATTHPHIHGHTHALITPRRDEQTVGVDGLSPSWPASSTCTPTPGPLWSSGSEPLPRRISVCYPRAGPCSREL